jgi:hypothetical protein
VSVDQEVSYLESFRKLPRGAASVVAAPCFATHGDEDDDDEELADEDDVAKLKVAATPLSPRLLLGRFSKSSAGE